MSKVALLEERIKKLDKLSADLDKEIDNQKKKGGYKDAPKYLLDIKREAAEQKALCEKERKILEEAIALKKAIKEPTKTPEEVINAKARKAELQEEYDKLVKDNASLHSPTSGGAADPCIPCLLKKAKQQDPAKHFIKFNVVDSAGKPRKHVSFQVHLPDGNARDVISDGTVMNIMNIEPGNCKIEFKWHSGATVYNSLIVS